MSIAPAFKKFPKLNTQHLVLREIRLSDSQAFYEILANPAVTAFYDDDAFTNISQAGDQIQSWTRGYQNQWIIRWGITRKGDDRLIGTCGFYGIHRWHLRASLGYELAQDFWRQGFMTEALSAITGYGFSQMGLNRIDAFIMPANQASIRLLEKLGFQKEGLLKGYERWGSKGFVDLLVYALLRTAGVTEPGL